MQALSRLREGSDVVVVEGAGGFLVPLAPGLTVAQVDVCDAVACAATHALQPTAAGPVNLVSVSIRGYTWDSVLGFIVPDLVLRPISVTMLGGQ